MKSVVVCGSKRYYKEIAEFCSDLEKLGAMVFAPSFHDPPFDEKTMFASEFATQKFFKGLTLEHFDWVRKAEVCFVYNKGDYAGTSVSLEMGYACALGKPIFALTPKTGDPCRDALIDKVIKTPKQLAALL
jgi:nucleoside 2-deoxyribosyltransferase